MVVCSPSDSIWRDWCSLCGNRFEAESPEELTQKILDHLEEKGDRDVTVNRTGVHLIWF